MAAILYLDVDDEITSAAARIRGATETKVALVLPPGSRLATSRINFRLLAREALERNRVLSIVAADPAARAIAASAGLPVHATVGEFEAATAPPPGPVEPSAPPVEAPPDDQPPAKRPRRRPAAAGVAGGAVAGAATGSAAAGAGSAAGAAATPAGPSAAAGIPGHGQAEQLSAELAAPSPEPPTPTMPAPTPALEMPPGMPTSETRARSGAATIPVVPTSRARGGLPGGLVAAFVALIVVVLILAVAGYLVLPQATIVVTPVAVPVGPVPFTVRADPDANSVDPVGGVIPATRLSQDFTASGEFPATGKRVVQTRAKGNLRWRNCDPTRAYTIPAGTVASTGSGIGFETDAAVFLPVAIPSPDGTRIDCQAKLVAARAVKTGPSGNVGAGSVTVVPSDLNAVVIKVTNPAAMTGGKREEFSRVQQSDIDAAMASLTKDLNAQFDAWTAAPPDLPPGATAFPATGHLGTPVPSVDPATLIDVEEPTFKLGATATGTVVAVDASQVDQVAAQRISANMPADHVLQAGSIKSSHDGAQADGDLIDFQVTASAAAIPVLDAAALREEIKGKSVGEARKVLEKYGTVSIDTWPGFVSSIPSLDFRLDLSVTGAAEGPGASSSPSAEPSVSAP